NERREFAGRNSELGSAANARPTGAAVHRSARSASGRAMTLFRKRFASTAMIVLVAIVLWGYVAGPLAATFRQSVGGPGGGFNQYLKFFDFRRGAQGESMAGSLILSLLSVVTSGVTGVFLAVLLKRWDFPLRKLCQVLVLVPIALPPLMGVEAFVL